MHTQGACNGWPECSGTYFSCFRTIGRPCTGSKSHLSGVTPPLLWLLAFGTSADACKDERPNVNNKTIDSAKAPVKDAIPLMQRLQRAKPLTSPAAANTRSSFLRCSCRLCVCTTMSMSVGSCIPENLQ